MQFIQNNFTAGEVSPRLAARSDLEKYKNGAKEMTNFMILPHGGATRRPGTRFVAECGLSTNVVLVRKFEFNTEQAYVIEIGPLYMRFYKDGGVIESSPGVPVEIVTPYESFDLLGLRFEQSADTLYITHTRHAARKLTRSSHTSWTLTGMQFTDGPYLPANTDSTLTITPSGTTGNITLTASAPLFDTTGLHDLSVWRLNIGGSWGYGFITSVTDSTHANFTVSLDLGGTTATSNWREGAWSAKNGYPATCGFNEERLFFAGSPESPLTVWGSKTGDFEDMTPGTTDDSAVEYTIASSRVNGFKWIMQDRGMLLGTAGAEFILRGGNDEPLTPSNVRASIQTSYGSNDVAPVKAGIHTVFAQRQGRKLRALSYTFNNDAYTAPDLTLLSEHITESGIVDMAYQQEPDSIIWAVTYDGLLLSLTYLPEQEVIGWSKHTTDGFFESVCVIPADGVDQVWVTVWREINGVPKRYVEYLDPTVRTDSALTGDGGPYVTLSNLDHLEGKEVAIVGDGVVLDYETVVGGSVTLSSNPVEAEAGLPFTSTLVTLRPEFQDREGSIQGRMKRWIRPTIRVYESQFLYINGDLTLPPAPNDDANLVFTGDIPVANVGWDRDGEITIEQRSPLPATILSVFGHVAVGD